MGAGNKRKTDKQAIQNRELSWLQFNRRVQEEADTPDNPLLERAKFLAIVTSNLDEFTQVRYERLYEAAQGERKRQKQQGGVRAGKLYRRVNREILRQNNTQYTLYEGIRSELYLKGIRLYPTYALDEDHIRREKALFEKQIRPYLRVEPLEGFRPKQKRLYLCVKLAKPRRRDPQFQLIAVPPALPRLFDISKNKESQCFIRVEDVVKHYLHRLFPKDEVEHAAVFRVLRNQNFPIEERTEDDIVPTVRGMLTKREDGAVMRLEAEERMSEEMLTLLMNLFSVDRERTYRVTGPLDLNKMLMGLYGLVKRPELKYPSAQSVEIPELMGDDVFEQIDRRDWLMYHPYHSFAPVVRMLRRAAVDPTVRAIRQTLYRVSGNSPIVAALAQAAENGKEVQVLFEAHARFDEENNLYWGERLMRAGCRVMYGLPNMKTHSKITLIEREVNGELHREAHLGTGNYHDGTARLYTDFGLLTADPVLTEDAAAFFRRLEGSKEELRELIQAPDMLQLTILDLIDRERANAAAGLPARILAKMNAISDEPIIRALLAAGREGVEIDLIVRGICCLIPGIEGVSDNIRVRSIVGRHLEHARAFVFENGGEPQVFLSSADWMPRNLYRRVELMFPVKDSRLAQAVRNVLTLQWNDTMKCRRRDAEGAYALPPHGRNGLNAQEALLADVEGVFAGTYPPKDERDAEDDAVEIEPQAPTAEEEAEYDAQTPTAEEEMEYDAQAPTAEEEMEYDAQAPTAEEEAEYDAQAPTAEEEMEYDAQASAIGEDTMSPDETSGL